MKYVYRMISMFLLLGIMFSNVIAQSELVIEWADGNGDVLINSFYNTVTADTLRPDDRVYVLKAGGYYQNSEMVQNDGWHLRIIGEAADPNDEFMNPPVLQMAPREDLSLPSGIIRGQGDITIKNVWITGASIDGDQTTYQPFQIDAANSTFLAENCIFDRGNFAMVAFTNGGNDITIKDCHFRNLIGRPSTQQWEGRGISIWADQKSVVIENNTFFNIGMTAIQIENGAADYARIVHNTFVNVGRIITQATWWREAYVANNVIVNGFWHAEGYIDWSPANRDPDLLYNGYHEIGALPSMYGPEEGRRILFANTAAYTAPEFTAYYADSLLVPWIIDNVTADEFIDVYDNMRIQDTLWVDPGMVTTTDTNYAKMIQNIEDLRAGVSPATEYFWELPAFDGEECFQCVTWPMTDDFSYTNAALLTASTNGLPLGDLNWFQDSKAIWEANHDEYVAVIEALAGDVVVYDLAGTEQAEDGTVADGAEVVAFEGESWYTVTGGTNIEFTFESAYAGLIDIKFKGRADGNNIGWDCILNGKNYVDVARGWGQFVWWTGADDPQTFWSGKSTTEFYEVTYLNAEVKEVDDQGTPFELVAGTNTLKCQNSWNDISFAYIELYEAGTMNLITKLLPSDAVNSGASPGGIGPWIPIGFKSVALNGGSTTLDFTVENDGNYVVQAFYQNYTGASSGNVLVDGSAAVTYDYDTDADSLGLQTLSGAFPLTAGAHTIGLSGNDINLDVVQLIQQTIISSVDDPNVPDGYSLSQNYPNPFNPTTKINFSLGKASSVKLTVYNILGQKVSTLLNTRLNAGSHSVEFKAGRFSSGVYFYGLEAGDVKMYKKMILLK